MPGVPTVIDLTTTTPAAPTGYQNNIEQADSNTPRNVSSYPQVATSSLFGVCVADNITIKNTGGVYSTPSGSGVIQAILIPSGTSYFPQIPTNFTITGWAIWGYGSTSGSASVDIWFLAGAAPPTTASIPTTSNKISAAAPVLVTSSQTASGGSSAIATWTAVLTQYGTVGFNLTSIVGFSYVQVFLFGTKH